MKALLKTGSDVATGILFDPECLDGVESAVFWHEADQPTVTRDGRALLFLPCSDGSYDFAIYVNEPPSEAFNAAREHHQTGMFLRVPSGHLVAAGLEEVAGKKQPRFAAASFKSPAEATCAIPPGLYHVEAWDQDPEALAEKHGAPVDRSAIPPRTLWIYRRVQESYGLGCMGTIIAVLGTGILVVKGLILTPWALLLALPLAYWLTVFKVIPSITPKWKELVTLETDKAKKDAEAFPSIVVCMTRIDAPPAKPNLGVFGEGRKEESAAS